MIDKVKTKARLLAVLAEPMPGSVNLISNSSKREDRASFGDESHQLTWRRQEHSRRQRYAKAALKRLDEGDYEICLHCEEEILPQRLEAAPYAIFCTGCQELLDQRQLPDQQLARFVEFVHLPPVMARPIRPQ